MLVGTVPLPVLPARAPSPNLFSLSVKPFACHTSKKSLETRAVNPFESTLLSLKFFPCHRSAKRVSNSFACHTSKITLLQALCLPHIRNPRGGSDFLLNSSPRRDFRPVRSLGLQRSRSVQSSVTNYQSPLTLDCELSIMEFSLGPIGGIDAHVLRREVAGPVARHGFTRVQIYNQRNVFGKKFVAGGALVEIERLAAAQDGNARHLDIHARGVKRNAGTPGGRENAAPVGVAAGEGSFHQRRSGDRFRNAARGGFILRVAHFDFDDALSAFAVSDDL